VNKDTIALTFVFSDFVCAGRSTTGGASGAGVASGAAAAPPGDCGVEEKGVEMRNSLGQQSKTYGDCDSGPSSSRFVFVKSHKLC